MDTEYHYTPQSVTHPGWVLEEKLEEMTMSVKEFALRTGKPEKTINAILKGQSSITPEMAVLFENVTKIPAHYWTNHQRAYDESVARQKHTKTIQEAIPWAKNFPINVMAALHWIDSPTNDIEKASAMLQFFGFSSHKAWDKYYFEQKLKVSFRISLLHSKEPYAISAWLRKGEIQCSQIEVAEYNANRLKEILPKLKQIMCEGAPDVFGKASTFLASAGVRLVYTPNLPKAPINGSTRWLADKPLIQISNRFKRNDVFWFTLFHEIGHILLHGKKDVFIESENYSENDKEKEQEADEFASNWLLTEAAEKEIISHFPLSENKIISFSEKYQTLPAIIVGRLQYKKHLKYKQFTTFIQQIEVE